MFPTLYSARSCFCLTLELPAWAPTAGQPTPPHRAGGHAGAPAPSPSGRCCAGGLCDAQEGCGEQGGCWRGGRGWLLPQELGCGLQEHPPTAPGISLPSQPAAGMPPCRIQGQAPRRSAPAGRTDHGQGPGQLQAPRGLKGAIVCPGL